MRDSLSKTQRKDISDKVKSDIPVLLEQIDFERCKSAMLFSKKFSHCTGYVRLKRTLNFAEWPHFQMNFGLTPNFSPDIELILKNLICKNRPMYEIWANRVKTPTEHLQLKNSARYSCARPGTWEFRNINEVQIKLQKMESYISDHFSSFIKTCETDEYLASYPLGTINELPPSFRVLQIVSSGRLGNLSNIKEIITYYNNSIFDKHESRFADPIKEYGNELLNYFS